MTVEHELGRLTEAVDGLRRDLANHHQSDMANFQEVFRRLGPLETHDAIEAARRAAEQGDAGHWHAWKQTIFNAIVALMSAGALVWSAFASQVGKH